MSRAESPGAMRSKAPSLAVLMVLVGISPLATDMYLAGLPALQTSLDTSATTAQLTLTGFLIGLAVGQLVIGPLSDGIGRRPFLLAGTAAFFVLSIVCALAPTGPVLVVARVLQGLAGAAGVVCGRAVISDHYPGTRADRIFALVTSVGFIGPVIAPAIGGVILTVATWRAIFLLLAVVGGLLLIGVVLRVPETLRPENRHPQSARANLSRMGALLSDRIFRGHVITSCLAVMGFFTYIGGSTFVLQRTYGIDEATYTVVFTTNAAAMVATSVVCALVIGRIGAMRVLRSGLVLTVTASLLLLSTGVAGFDRLAWTWITLCGVTAGMGLVLPSSIALAQRAGATYAGTASALLGGLQFALGGLVAPLTGLIGYTSVTPMAAIMSVFMVLSAGWSATVVDPAGAETVTSPRDP